MTYSDQERHYEDDCYELECSRGYWRAVAAFNALAFILLALAVVYL